MLRLLIGTVNLLYEKDETSIKKLQQRLDELTNKVNDIIVEVEKLSKNNIISNPTITLLVHKRIQKWSLVIGQSFFLLFITLIVASFFVGFPRRIDMDTRRIHITPEADILSAFAIICVPVALLFLLLEPESSIKPISRDDDNGH